MPSGDEAGAATELVGQIILAFISADIVTINENKNRLFRRQSGIGFKKIFTLFQGFEFFRRQSFHEGQGCFLCMHLFREGGDSFILRVEKLRDFQIPFGNQAKFAQPLEKVKISLC